MGRPTAEEKGFAPGIWVRLPAGDDARLRALVLTERPLGVVARQLLLRGLELELAERREARRRKA